MALLFKEINYLSDRDDDKKGMQVLHEALSKDSECLLSTNEKQKAQEFFVFLENFRKQFNKKELEEYYPRIFIYSDSEIADNQIVGLIMFNVHSFRNAQGTYCIWIKPEWQRHGYGARMLKKFLDNIFREEAWLKMIKIKIFGWNEISKKFHSKILLSQEFKNEYNIENCQEKKAGYLNGKYIDHEVYIIEKK